MARVYAGGGTRARAPAGYVPGRAALEQEEWAGLQRPRSEALLEPMRRCEQPGPASGACFHGLEVQGRLQGQALPPDLQVAPQRLRHALLAAERRKAAQIRHRGRQRRGPTRRQSRKGGVRVHLRRRRHPLEREGVEGGLGETAELMRAPGPRAVQPLMRLVQRRLVGDPSVYFARLFRCCYADYQRAERA